MNHQTYDAVEALKSEAQRAVLDDLTALAFYNKARARLAELPAELKQARANVKAVQADHDEAKAQWDEAAAVVRQARAERELIDPHDKPARSRASDALAPLESTAGNLHADYSQRHLPRLNKALAAVDDLTALQAALEAVHAPDVPTLAAIVAALAERV